MNELALSAPAPPHQLFYSGNKLVWRSNRAVDFRIFVSETAGYVVLRSFDFGRDREFPPLVMRLDAIFSPTHKRTEGRAPVWGSEFTSKRRRTTGGIQQKPL
jgi:hypothetical protein